MQDETKNTDWRTTDQEEIARRRERAIREPMQVVNLSPEHPVYSNFAVRSERSGQEYRVEVRSLEPLACSCTCVDFRVNGLGTCKHVERVLRWLESDPSLVERARKEGSDRIDLVPDLATGRLLVERNLNKIPLVLRDFFDLTGLALPEFPNGEILMAFECSDRPAIRVSQDVRPWLQQNERNEERIRLRRDYEQRVRAGVYPAHETKIPLLPYQREGMLHLAFTERALLADEMGLGKTIQAIAAAALLHRLGKVNRVLVVAPASLKTEWEEQIKLFTDLPYQLVFGTPEARKASYENAVFFTLTNYEQVVRDVAEMNAELKPDCVILDEAQRIKNWDTQTAQAVKRLQGRYVFILTGTPLENRIDEIYSLMSIIDPLVLGPLFRFNRDFYELNDKGRPVGCKNLHLLRQRLQPYLLRRRKADVEKELPDRTERTVFVNMTPQQRALYTSYEERVGRLLAQTRVRPLTPPESERLQRELSMMRMVCDTPSILQPDFLDCPKLDEVRDTLEAALSTPGVKALVFSEWERMLARVRGLCDQLGIAYAWHTGSVPQQKRRDEIQRFKNTPECRVFLSTDTGGLGLNLQQASIVINCDLPWSPARLEQRVSRAWRKNQVRNVTVINLVAEDSIESRMMDTLARKRALAGGVLDGDSGVDSVQLGNGREGLLKQLAAVIPLPSAGAAAVGPSQPQLEILRAQDPELGFASVAAQELGDKLITCEYCQPPQEHPVLLLVIDGDMVAAAACAERIRSDWFGKCVGMLTPVVETIPPATYAAIKRLMSSGLLTRGSAQSRVLYRRDGGGLAEPRVAPDSGKARVQALRRQAVALYRHARQEISGLAFDQARQPLSDTVVTFAKAYAIEQDIEEPENLRQALEPRFGVLWGDALPILSSELLAQDGSPVLASRILMPFFGG